MALQRALFYNTGLVFTQKLLFFFLKKWLLIQIFILKQVFQYLDFIWLSLYSNIYNYSVNIMWTNETRRFQLVAKDTYLWCDVHSTEDAPIKEWVAKRAIAKKTLWNYQESTNNKTLLFSRTSNPSRIHILPVFFIFVQVIRYFLTMKMYQYISSKCFSPLG